jgi:hypothetical protein
VRASVYDAMMIRFWLAECRNGVSGKRHHAQFLDQFRQQSADGTSSLRADASSLTVPNEDYKPRSSDQGFFPP